MLAAVGVASLDALSCNGKTDDDVVGSLPCAVDRVLQAQCRSCHTAPPQYGAPMPLLNYSDLHARAKTDPSRPVYELVHDRTHDDKKPMPDPPRPRLRAEDQRVLDDWITQGAPSGEGTCGVDVPDSGPPVRIDGGPRDTGPDTRILVNPPPESCPNVTLKASAPWHMTPQMTDEYVCFGVDVQLGKDRHIVAFAPNIQNSVIAHHALVYLSDTSESGVPYPCNWGSVLGKRLVYGWAPGGEQFELPAEAGLRISGLTHLVVQMHYSNLQRLDQTDQSSIDLCTTETLRPNDADVVAFGAMQFQIPPRKTYELDCSLDLPAAVPPLHVFRSMPHMHQIGKTIGSSLQQPGGSPQTIDEVTQWSFGSQPWNAVDVTLQGGDNVRTWCSWENGSGDPVVWGERTSDEMCYHFMMYWPRIVYPGWNWQAPVGMASCVEK